MAQSQKSITRLIVADSERDADMLYATGMFVGDPFIFLEQNGSRTIVLSDLEIDRGKRQAKVDEILPYSQFEREVQGNATKAPPFGKVLAHFLQSRRVRSALVPATFLRNLRRVSTLPKMRISSSGSLGEFASEPGAAGSRSSDIL